MTAGVPATPRVMPKTMQQRVGRELMEEYDADEHLASAGNPDPFLNTAGCPLHGTRTPGAHEAHVRHSQGETAHSAVQSGAGRQ